MYFRFAMNFIAKKTSRTAVSIILCVVSVIVIVFTVILGAGTNYAYDELDLMLSGGIKSVAEISADTHNAEFVGDLVSQPEINAVGSVQTYTSHAFSNLASKYNFDLEQYPYNNEIIFMDRNLINLYDISLQSGQPLTELNDFSKTYLYLGSGFKEIPIGSVYTSNSEEYVVAGILSKGQRLIANKFVDQINHNQASYTIDGEYGVLAVTDYSTTDGLLLSTADGYTVKDALDKALSVAEKHNANLTYTTLQMAFDRANEYTAVVKTIFSRILPVMIISCVLMILIMQLSDIYGSLHEYGILCSTGFTQTDVEKITVIKNVITFVIAFIISLPLTYLLIWFWCSWGSTDTNVIFYLMLTSALPAAIVIILCTIAISTVISIALIRKYTPVQMIGGHND